MPRYVARCPFGWTSHQWGWSIFPTASFHHAASAAVVALIIAASYSALGTWDSTYSDSRLKFWGCFDKTTTSVVQIYNYKKIKKLISCRWTNLHLEVLKKLVCDHKPRTVWGLILIGYNDHHKSNKLIVQHWSWCNRPRIHMCDFIAAVVPNSMDQDWLSTGNVSSKATLTTWLLISSNIKRNGSTLNMLIGACST